MNNTEIIDNFDQKKPDNRTVIFQVLGASAFTFVLFIAMLFVNPYLPEKVTLFGNAHFRIADIILVLIVLLFGRYLPQVLNEFKPAIPSLLIAFITGLNLLAIEFTFKILQNLFFVGNGFDLNYNGIAFVAAIMGGMGMFIALDSILKSERHQSGLSPCCGLCI